MVERRFDVVVHAFGLRAAESLSDALARIVELDANEAARLSTMLPCKVLANVSYARAESVVASLLLAGADAQIAPHVSSESRGHATLLEVGLAKAREDAVAALGAARDPSLPSLRIASEPPRWLGMQPANEPPSIHAAPAARDARVAPLAAFAPKAAAAAAAQLQRASELPHRVSTGAAQTAAKLELAPSAHVDPVPAAPHYERGLVTSFGLPTVADLEEVFANAPPLAPALDPRAEDASVARGASFGSLALPLELAIPPRAARTAPPVSAALRITAPSASSSTSSNVATARRPPSRVPPVAPASNEVLLPPRTLWLLGILWLSVALLLWTNGLLF